MVSMLVAYEVQSYQAGEWVIQSIFDDKELALMEARRMEQSGLRRQETRVVQETYDESQDKSRSKIIYETPLVRNEEQAAPQGKTGGPQRAAQQAPRVDPPAKRRRSSTKAQSSGPSYLMICLAAVGLLIGAAVAFYAVRMIG